MSLEPRKIASCLIVWVASAACDGALGANGGRQVEPDRRADASTDAAVLPDTGPPPDAEAPPTDAAAPPPDAAPGVYRLGDPLRGGTLGNPVGGTFGEDGWTAADRTDRIWYALPRLVQGSIEFTVSNIRTETLNPTDNEIFTMYEAGYGMAEPINYNPEYRNNHYKGMIRIYGALDDDRIGLQKLMWGMCPSGAPGHDECGCASFFEEPFGGDPSWDGSAQRLRVEWGGGTARYLRNGVEVVSVDWSASGLSFGPEELHFTLGSPRAPAVADSGVPAGAVFSDLVVEGIEGDLATCP